MYPICRKLISVLKEHNIKQHYDFKRKVNEAQKLHKAPTREQMIFFTVVKHFYKKTKKM